MELGTNNSDDKRFGQPSIMLFNVKGFPLFPHPYAMSSKTCTFKSSQLCKMGRKKTN
jgi:hypothetical protein